MTSQNAEELIKKWEYEKMMKFGSADEGQGQLTLATHDTIRCFRLFACRSLHSASQASLRPATTRNSRRQDDLETLFRSLARTRRNDGRLHFFEWRQFGVAFDGVDPRNVVQNGCVRLW